MFFLCKRHCKCFLSRISKKDENILWKNAGIGKARRGKCVYTNLLCNVAMHAFNFNKNLLYFIAFTLRNVSSCVKLIVVKSRKKLSLSCVKLFLWWLKEEKVWFFKAVKKIEFSSKWIKKNQEFVKLRRRIN